MRAQDDLFLQIMKAEAKTAAKPLLPIEVMLQNETHAVRALRSVAIAQMQCRATKALDVDGDGRGEYAYFGELAGSAQLRDRYGNPTQGLMSPPVLAGNWGEMDQGVVFQSGYCFSMFLPGPEGSALAEGPDGGAVPPGPLPRLARQRWACCAWPQRYGVTGELAFCMDQDGSLAATSNRRARYSGFERRPGFGAARLRPDDSTRVDFWSSLALARLGVDGQFWQFYDISFAESRHGQGLSRARMAPGDQTSVLTADLDADPHRVIPEVLRRIVSAQVQCTVREAIDADGDELGEFGFFAELAGTRFLRERTGIGSRLMRPVLLGPEFGDVEDGIIVHRGYCFRLVLPGRRGVPILESSFGGTANTLDLQPDPDLAREHFLCYAWPLDFGLTGREVYVVGPSGRVLLTRNEDQRYSGIDDAPGPCAALKEEGSIAVPLMPLSRAADGATWIDQGTAEPPR